MHRPPPNTVFIVADEHPLLPSLPRAAGCRTPRVGKWHLGYPPRSLPAPVSLGYGAADMPQRRPVA